jgi:ubiquinone/menaquinone biosynthesis C-methylase UbiE
MDTPKGNKKFWNRAASKYDSAIKKNQDEYDHLIRQITGELNSDMDVLELAAGTGYIALRLAPFCNSITATDFSEEMIRTASRKVHPENLSFAVQDATSLDYGDNSFDAVVICHALHILPDPPKALAGIRRVLKDDGILIAPVTALNGGFLEKISEITTRISARIMGLRNLSILTFAEYLRVFEDNGWVITKSSCGKGRFPLAFVVAKKLHDK